MNVAAGTVPGAVVKLTNPVTLYVPLAVPTSAPDVAQVPPPVTSEPEPKVPLPVNVILLARSLPAKADAVPPGEMTIFPDPKGSTDSWMMSHRILWSPEFPAAPPTSTEPNKTIAPASGR